MTRAHAGGMTEAHLPGHGTAMAEALLPKRLTRHDSEHADDPVARLYVMSKASVALGRASEAHPA